MIEPLDVIRGLAAMFGRPAPRVGQTPADVVHEENKWRLLRYVPRPEGVAFRTPVLLIPSLINRHYVLDLMSGKSFAEHLVAHGHDVYVIDWGTPEAEDRFVTFEDVVVSAIGRALRVTTRTAKAESAHVLGYCLGGTLAVIHAALAPERVRTLMLVAAPVDFHDDGLLSKWTRTRTLDTTAVVDGAGNVPWPLMQGAFHLLRPTLPLVKAVTLAEKAWDEPFLDGFFAIETWGNDNVSFPGECWRTYIDELYRKNALMTGSLRLGGRTVELSSLRCPLLCVTFEHDEIVPHRSASAVVERVASTDKEHLHVPGGHVGAMVSKSASKKLWPALRTFWATRDEATRLRGELMLQRDMAVASR
ncbi:alpha/beta fold hydrolase [Sandaracinus amylolyticus]|uniref:Polyhydroxyalkanoic acid synthase n=1 Tax=Sandaracinus amylolyticus TaxID=927083 RepID=A0A0F6SHX7_9BACT|nr:alpha/beta fold hydrolase [Sandaracinus amylolyticus]AKF11214.1 Polyhydroxyalkanoic acid synthase [Sandaracinus amylolyticus]